MGDTTIEKLNGIDTEALKQVMEQVSKDPSVGKLEFQVITTWKGATKSETVVQGYEIGGQKDGFIPLSSTSQRDSWVKTRPPIPTNTLWGQ